jgi:uncharacterized protein (DUF1786 family)
VKNLILTKDELRIVHQALNEVCHGIEVPEFSTRMGASKVECVELMDKLVVMMDTKEARA